MTKKSIREFLIASLNEDYKFPLIEVFFFLFILFTCISANTSSIGTTEYAAYTLVGFNSTNFMLSIFIYIILVSKNVAFSLSSELEKGTMKTYFSYPIKRREILTCKLFSEIAVTSIIYFAANFISLLVIAPSTIIPNMGVILVSYAATFAFVLVISSIVALTALLVKKGSLTLIVGVILFIVLFIALGISYSIAFQSNSSTPLEVVSYINPMMALSYYYHPDYSGYSSYNPLWDPSFNQIVTNIAGCFAISAVLLGLSYYYFDRRMSL